MRRIIALFGVIISTFSLSGCDDFKSTCQGMGGTYKTDVKIVNTTVVDPNGKVSLATTTVTIYLCIKDGEVIMQA